MCSYSAYVFFRKNWKESKIDIFTMQKLIVCKLRSRATKKVSGLFFVLFSTEFSCESRNWFKDFSHIDLKKNIERVRHFFISSVSKKNNIITKLKSFKPIGCTTNDNNIKMMEVFQYFPTLLSSLIDQIKQFNAIVINFYFHFRKKYKIKLQNIKDHKNHCSRMSQSVFFEVSFVSCANS